MKVYQYHPITKEYLYESIADKDPLVADNWLIPASSTTVPLEFEHKDGFAIIYNIQESIWEYIVDNRGVTYWLNSEESLTIQNLGQVVPDEAYLTQPEKEEDYAKKEHLWVIAELMYVDTQLMYHWTGDITRQSYTEQDWKDYAIALRNYTTLVDNIPVVNSDVRPTSPYSA